LASAVVGNRVAVLVDDRRNVLSTWPSSAHPDVVQLTLKRESGNWLDLLLAMLRFFDCRAHSSVLQAPPTRRPMGYTDHIEPPGLPC
jgi:hypothetical protein